MTACATTTEELTKLRTENARLQMELTALKNGEDPVPEFEPIQRFIVGLAAAEQDFDQGAFESLLRESLADASSETAVRLGEQNSAREVAKIRGMLVQQYLAAEEVPILISNLSYKLKNPDNGFRIGGSVVPARGQVRTASAEGAVFTYNDNLPAVLRRGAGGKFSIDYEETGQGRGAVEVDLTDVDMIASEGGARAGRQGDISFNWKLNLAKVQVYQVDGFKGDVGKFLRQMRLGGSRSELSQFQTLQDSVFLFGYGSYRTDVVSQLRTPSFIDQVEVAPLGAELPADLRRSDNEDALLESFGSGVQWQQCQPIETAGTERVWRRPIAVGFPFVSRQTSTSRNLVFYSVYSAEGTRLLGNFSR